MTPDMQQELLKRLDALSAKLGVSADALWQLYMRQARIEGIQDLIALLIGVGLTVILLVGSRVAFKRYREEKKKRDYDSCEIPAAVLSWTFGALAPLSFGIGLSYAFDAITPLLNPGFWAFSQIVSALK